MRGKGGETLLEKGFLLPSPRPPSPPLPKTFMFIESLLPDSGEAGVSGSGEEETPMRRFPDCGEGFGKAAVVFGKADGGTEP